MYVQSFLHMKRMVSVFDICYYGSSWREAESYLLQLWDVSCAIRWCFPDSKASSCVNMRCWVACVLVTFRAYCDINSWNTINLSVFQWPSLTHVSSEDTYHKNRCPAFPPWCIIVAQRNGRENVSPSLSAAVVQNYSIKITYIIGVDPVVIDFLHTKVLWCWYITWQIPLPWVIFTIWVIFAFRPSPLVVILLPVVFVVP